MTDHRARGSTAFLEPQRVLGWLVFGLSLLPALRLGGLAWPQQLGVNPVETLSHSTGAWALRFLLLTLALSPLQRWTGWTGWRGLRRMLGLFAFFYAVLHMAVYLVFEQFFDSGAILDDLIKRPFITVGFLSGLLLIPLAITSTRGLRQRLGQHWQQLHRLIYLSALLGVLHYYWLVKVDVTEPWLYAAILAVLLGERLWQWWFQSATVNRSTR